MRVLENGWLGHLHAGAPLRPGALAARTSARRRFDGLRQPRRRAGGARGPGAGRRRLPRPGAGRRGPGRLDRARPALRRPPDRRPASRTCRACRRLRRGRRRGGDARGRPRRRADRPARSTVRTTLFARPPGRRPVADARATAAAAPLDRPLRDERRPRPAGRRLDTSSRSSGTWARERARRTTGPSSRAASPSGSLRGATGARAQPVPRRCAAPTTTEDAGEAFGAEPRVLRQLPRRGARSTRSGPPGCGSASTPRRSRWRLEPGATFTTPEAVIAWSGDGPRRPVSDAFHGLFRERLARGPWRDRAAAGRAQQLGGDLLRLRPRPDRRDRAARRKDLGVELFVLDDGWFGAARRRRLVARRLGRRPAQAARAASRRWPATSTAWGCKFGLWIEPEMVNADSDLFRAHPDWAIGVPGRGADGEPPAARPRPRAGPRSSTTSRTR